MHSGAPLIIHIATSELKDNYLPILGTMPIRNNIDLNGRIPLDCRKAMARHVMKN